MPVDSDVVIVSACRTPFSKFGGVLRDYSSVELGALAIQEVLRRAGVSGDEVDEVNMGVAGCAEAGFNGAVDARQAMLKAGVNPSALSMHIDRACCSSLAAVQVGFRNILHGYANIVVAGGAENMGRNPLMVPASTRWGSRVGNIIAKDPLFNLGYEDYAPVAKDTGEVAMEYGVGREEQDAWACRSQRCCDEAQVAGKFDEEIFAVEVPQRKGPPIIFDKDETPKPTTTMEGLAKLPTVNGSPTCTAGNAPGLDTGAAMVLMMRRSEAIRRGLAPLCRIRDMVSAAMGPRLIAVVPAKAIKKLLALPAQKGLTLADVDLIEINEAFAAQPLVSTKILSDGDPLKWQALREKTNINGGAVALGHPVGVSGARILMTAAYELRRRGGGRAVLAICGGLAQGEAVLIEVESIPKEAS